jgi:hypothetical protein
MARHRRDEVPPVERSPLERLFEDMQLEDGPQDVAYQEDWSVEEWELRWRESRERLVEQSARRRPGTRPWTWWWLDAPAGPQDEEFGSDWEQWLAELEFLAAIGELSEDELARLLAPRPVPRWREGHVTAQFPPPGVFLEAEAEAEREAVRRGLARRDHNDDQGGQSQNEGRRQQER